MKWEYNNLISCHHATPVYIQHITKMHQKFIMKKGSFTFKLSVSIFKIIPYKLELQSYQSNHKHNNNI